MMDLIDLLWLCSHDRSISEVKSEIETAQLVSRLADNRQTASADELRAENFELKLRLGLLIRLLIERGVFSAAEYKTLVEETESRIAASAPPVPPSRAFRGPRKVR